MIINKLEKEDCFCKYYNDCRSCNYYGTCFYVCDLDITNKYYFHAHCKEWFDCRFFDSCKLARQGKCNEEHVKHVSN